MRKISAYRIVRKLFKKIEIAACEPEVVDPVTVRFDEAGRMWVAEYRDYPNGPAPGAKPLSRIKLLEDKDGDGRFERRASTR